MAKATSKPGIHGFLAGLGVGVGAGLTVATGVGETVTAGVSDVGVDVSTGGVGVAPGAMKFTVVVFVTVSISPPRFASPVIVATPSSSPAVNIAVAVPFIITADLVILPREVLKFTVRFSSTHSSPFHTEAVIVDMELPSARISAGFATRFK